MNVYKIIYSTGTKEHVTEIEAEDKETARQIALVSIVGKGQRLIDVVHVPESYSLF